MVAKMEKPGVNSDPEALRELIRDGAMANRSSLFRWMRQNYEMMCEELGEAGRVSWEELSQRFTRLGLKDKNQNAPTAECARKTWVRVQQLVARRGKLKFPKPRGSQAKVATDVKLNPDGSPKVTFEFARMKGEAEATGAMPARKPYAKVE